MDMHLVWIARIATGAVLGAMIGYERDRHKKQAGLRTHLLVGMASATFMVVSIHFVHFQGYSERQLVGVDGSRIASSVVTGIGFLAGGAILRTGLSIQGLTTAAALWLVTAIGLAAGGGMYAEAVVVTALGHVALSVLVRFENKKNQTIRRRISMMLAEESKPIERIEEVLKQLGATVSDIEYKRRLDDRPRLLVIFDVEVPVSVTIGSLTEQIESVKEVRRLHVTQPR
jgi:putative Mg2+ transporter-C (MgtC) family protein